MKTHFSIIVLTLSILFLSGCNSPLGSNSDVTALLKSADSSTAQMRHARSGKIYIRNVQYKKPETQQMVNALLVAKGDGGTYDTPVTLHSVKFYAKSKCVAEIATCSNLFVFRGEQYRDKTGTLSKFVDTPLDSVQDIEENGPEPEASSISIIKK